MTVDPTPPTAKTRLVWLDLLRIFASMLIVMLNLSAPLLPKMAVSHPYWQSISAYAALARPATLLFTMLSSVLFLDIRKAMPLKRLFAKPVRRIVIIYAVWSLIYAVFTLLTTGGTLKDLIPLTLSSHYHLWFLPVLIGLYLMAPFLHAMLRHSPDVLVPYALALFLLGTIVHTLLSAGELLPFTGELAILAGKFPLGTFFLFLGYFLLGYALTYVFSLTHSQVGIAYLLGGASALAAIALTALVSRRSGVSDQRFSDRLSLMAMLQAIALFLFFRTAIPEERISQKGREFIITVSRLTLGVFLVHPLVIFLLDRGLNLSVTSFHPIVSIPILTLLVFALSAGFIYLLKKIPRLCWLA